MGRVSTWQATVHRVTRVRHNIVTKQQQIILKKKHKKTSENSGLTFPLILLSFPTSAF